MVMLEGTISYDQRPYANLLSRLFKDRMNANSRMFLRSLNPFDRNPEYVSEKDFNKQQLEALRQAIVNREYAIKYNRPGWDTEGRRAISYEDYGPSTYTNSPIFAPSIKSMNTIARLQNTKDPVWDMQTTIGSADYTIDPGGNVSLVDRYNFNKGTDVSSPTLNIAHTLGKLFSNPYDIRIDLGNINKWGLTPDYDIEKLLRR